MKPIKFKEQNCTFAENQPQYEPLPSYKNDDEVISLWSLSFKERLQVLFYGKIWLRVLWNGLQLHPVFLQTTNPFNRKK